MSYGVEASGQCNETLEMLCLSDGLGRLFCTSWLFIDSVVRVRSFAVQ